MMGLSHLENSRRYQKREEENWLCKCKHFKFYHEDDAEECVKCDCFKFRGIK